MHLRLIVAGALCLSAVGAAGRELYPGQYAQVDPAERAWFSDQKVPGTHSSCCSQADGVTAEEDIRDGHYWARFVYQQWQNDKHMYLQKDSGWMQVPDAAILDTNHQGAPIVWWYIPADQVMIRCYARGTGF